MDEDDAVDPATWYADGDGDSFGDAKSTMEACSQPSGYVADATDCDDGNSAVNPAADDYCNGVDDDCDDDVDEDSAVDATTWYPDVDADSYGDSRYGTPSCAALSGYVTDATDCDDLEASVHPGADEYCDGVDNDCEGDIDEDDAVDSTTWCIDSDSDGYGDASTCEVDCYEISGYVADATDCYDSNASAYPGQTSYFSIERGDGSYDYDCDGTETYEFPDCWDGDCSACPNGDFEGGWRYSDVLCTIPPDCGEEECWIETCNDAYYLCPATQVQTCR